VSFTLQDAKGTKLDSLSPIEIVSSGLGRYADTWCVLPNNAAQEGNATMSAASSSSSAAASAVVTVYPGQNSTSENQDSSPWLL
jgi:hypothetical protein